jgi:3-deoxy-manno-octulosonate cytidylyltransferase (CMP-KDO synthetase)
MRIAKSAFAWGAEVALTSSKHRSGADRIAEIARKASEFSHVLNIQGDEPLTDPKLINRLVHEMRRDRAVEMITAAHPFLEGGAVQSENQVKVVIDAKKNALYFSRSAIPFLRDSSSTVRPLRHQGIYGYTRDLLLRFVRWKPSPLECAESLEQLRALENGVKIRVVVTGSGWPGVDTPEDSEVIERQLALEARAPSPRKSRNAR